MSRRLQRNIALFVALVLAVSSLACGVGRRPDASRTERAPEVGSTDTPTPAPASPTPTPQVEQVTPTPLPSPTDTPQPAEPREPPAEAPSEQGPLGVAQIPELQVTTLDPRGTPLTKLGTFRQRMTAEFVASESVHNGVYQYDAEVNTAAQAVHVTVSVEGAAAQQFPSNRAEAIWIGAQLWVKVGNLPWVLVPEETAEARFEEQTVSVGAFLPYVPTFTRVQPDETVNGIACVHYTYDVQDIPAEYGTVDARGETWVAIDGGYVVRYTLEAVGTFGAHFSGDGVLSLTYDTYDVGAEIEIDPPRR